MARVWLGLGSNVDPEKNLKLGVRALRERYGELIVSPVYRNAAIGFHGDDFLNLVVGLDCDDAPEAINREIEAIHARAGRRRGAERFSSRPLDIDLLLYDDLVCDRPGCRVPREDVLDYSFVLKPLADVAPDLVHPVTGRTMRDHWRAFERRRHPLERVRVIL